MNSLDDIRKMFEILTQGGKTKGAIANDIKIRYETRLSEDGIEWEFFSKEILPKIMTPLEQYNSIKSNIAMQLQIKKQRNVLTIVQSPLSSDTNIESYYVKDYDHLLHNLKASAHFPFIKFTKRSGEVFYKVYKDFVVPEEWFSQDDDDFLVKIKKTDKIRKDIDDVFTQAYIKKLRDDDEKNIMIIHHENISSLKPIYNELKKYVEPEPIKTLFSGQCTITNSNFTPVTKMYFTDHIFFNSKNFEFDESKNTVGAKKDRYYLKKRNEDIRLSFTKIYANQFTLKIARVEETKANQIISELVDELYAWNARLPKIKADYDAFFQKFYQKNEMNDAVRTPSEAPAISLNKTQPRVKSIPDYIEKLATAKYGEEVKSSEFFGKGTDNSFGKVCQKKFQPYVIADKEAERDFENFVKNDTELKKENIEKLRKRVTVNTSGPDPKTVDFDIACVPRNDQGLPPTSNPYPQAKEHGGYIYPCCTLAYKETGGVAKKVVTVDLNARVQITTNKNIMFGKRRVVDTWWKKYFSIIETPTEKYTGQYLLYSLSFNDTTNSMLRNVLYAKDVNAPINNSELLEKYIAEQELPTDVTYKTHVAELSKTYNVNIVVFNDDGTLVINEATPEFKKNLDTIIMIMRDKFYELMIEEQTRSAKFSYHSHPNLYGMLDKLFQSYKSYQIVKNNFVI